MNTEAKQDVFSRLEGRPDHDHLEREVLDWWAENDTFGKLREANAGAEPFSFIDGPVTANKTLGVHTAWGRTLKDVFQRYKALRGYDLRFQNGFDCQGLWIEVGVEKELGLNSKREIEEFGLEEFARRCREKVAWSVDELRRGSQRLGNWMDWDNDYLTFSDTNIEYIWKFLKTLRDSGMAVPRPSIHGVVPTVRDVDLPTRDNWSIGGLSGEGRPVAVRATPPDRSRG